MNLLEGTLPKIFPQDHAARLKAKERLEQLVMPYWALAELMDLAVDLAGMTRNPRPEFAGKVIVVMAADHGVTAEKVSKYPGAVTAQMVHSFVRGQAGINLLAAQAGADVIVVDMGVNADLLHLADEGKIINKKVGLGTGNIARGPAMSVAMARRSVESGIEIANLLGPQYDLFGTGDMGIGNTTSSTAIAALCTGGDVAVLTGRGTGLNDVELTHKVSVIRRILEINRPNPKNGLDMLSKVGGFEIGGIAGLILGAAAQGKPVVIDGFIATAGALIAARIEPFIRDYLIFSHRSAEPGHQAMQETLGCRRPLLDLGLRLGEGSGAALAMPLVSSAAALLSRVATFAEAAVSEAGE
jgi:nicotinate-nucleotide--dimethylbenzimidazole phosphoribosyltransferase